MAARSPALACAAARLDSTVRRTRPHTSISQLVARLTRSWVVVLLPAAAALAEAVLLPPPLWLRVEETSAGVVGKEPPRAGAGGGPRRAGFGAAGDTVWLDHPRPRRGG